MALLVRLVRLERRVVMEAVRVAAVVVHQRVLLPVLVVLALSAVAVAAVVVHHATALTPALVVMAATATLAFMVCEAMT